MYGQDSYGDSGKDCGSGLAGNPGHVLLGSEDEGLCACIKGELAVGPDDFFQFIGTVPVVVSEAEVFQDVEALGFKLCL